MWQFSTTASVTRCWNETMPKFFQSYPKIGQSNFCLKEKIFKIANIELPKIWANFVRKFIAEAL